MTSAESHLLICLQAAVRAGRAIMSVYESDFTVETKSDQSPLTLADKQAHDIIAAFLQPTGIPVLSEEGRQIEFKTRQSWSRLWIVDPLDGTKEFVNRNGEFTVNIALVENGRPVLGVIYVPVKQILYFGAVGIGSHKTDDSLFLEGISAGEPASRADIIARSVRLPLVLPSRRVPAIVGSRSHMTEEVEEFVEKKRAEYGEVEFVAAGSSLKICLVAEGTADIYPRLGSTMEWDIAAGQAIAENAGANFYCYETGQKMRYNRADLKNPWFVVERPMPASASSSQIHAKP
ncbi:MAG: 3'(2'),5'-bisphosphate nucleotidase CysQ [Desulfosudaceae bacterium]